MIDRLGRGLLAAVIVAGVLAAALIPLYRASRDAAAADIPAMVRRTEIRLGPETTGRLASLEVVRGQRVKKGDLVAMLSNPELEAALGEARAAAASARADREKVYSGVRKEEVAIAAAAVSTAQANLLLAEQQKARADALFARGFASSQQVDQATASFDKAQADLDLKQAQHAAALAGPTAEERALADARVALAEATVADFQAQLDKTRLTAPVDGLVGVQVAALGEIVAPGAPVMTIEVDDGRWFTFTLREDGLGGITIGSPVRLRGPDDQVIDARVTELRPLGQFATWRAARAVGDHDINSFRVRLDADAPAEALQPGMTVWLPAER